MSAINWRRPRKVFQNGTPQSDLERRAALALRSWAGGAFAEDRAPCRTRRRVSSPAAAGNLAITTSIERARQDLATATRATVHCDGCTAPSNPGPSAWGAVIDSDAGRFEISGSIGHSTNNRAELAGAIASLEALPAMCRATIITDSNYVVMGMNTWIAGWRRKGFRRAGGPIPNADLWKRLGALAAGRTITWQWVRGHNGNAGNERADKLARTACRGAMQ